jgi:prepilin-type N-terminal cleavage/methylation domain-containing protein
MVVTAQRSSVRRRPRGMSLAELLVATAIGAGLLAALGSVARLGVQARAQTRDGNEAIQQARFALQRVAAAARDTAPHSLLAPAANTSGDWFSPVYFCLNGSQALVETTSADTACSAGRVVAERVSSFGLTPADEGGALTAESAAVSITTQAAAGATVTLTERLRLGGGTQ